MDHDLQRYKTGSVREPEHSCCRACGVRMAKMLGFLGLGGSAAFCLSRRFRNRQRVSGNHYVPEPLREVELSRYAGRWYELGRYDAWFERGRDYAMAEYRPRSDGGFDVINSSIKSGARHARRSYTKGRAWVVPSSGNARLKVAFSGAWWARFFAADYWILDHGEQYSWAIVGEPTGKYLWILCRQPDPPEEAYQVLVERARGLGYDMQHFRRTRQA